MQCQGNAGEVKKEEAVEEETGKRQFVKGEHRDI